MSRVLRWEHDLPPMWTRPSFANAIIISFSSISFYVSDKTRARSPRIFLNLFIFIFVIIIFFFCAGKNKDEQGLLLSGVPSNFTTGKSNKTSIRRRGKSWRVVDVGISVPGTQTKAGVTPPSPSFAKPSTKREACERTGSIRASCPLLFFYHLWTRLTSPIPHPPPLTDPPYIGTPWVRRRARG